jgi:hypothetical protein
MPTLFGLFSLDTADAAAAELEASLGAEAVNLIASAAIKERLAVAGHQPAPTLAHLMGRKRPVFVGEAGTLFGIHALAAHVLELAQSAAPTKLAGSLKVALEEYGVTAHYAEAYATAVAHGYVLLFADVPEPDTLEISERLEALGGREVFTFQRLE